MAHPDDTYEAFADFYATGMYTLHSERMADQFRDTLALLDVDAERVLDVACGEGSFATSIAEDGFEVTGIDVSESMIELAREKAAESDADPDFHVVDAREFDLPGSFDVVTCWFDSINHFLELDDVEAVFERVYASLEDGGLFVFDVNTVQRLAEREARDGSVVRDTESRFEAYTDVRFDAETNLLTLTITGFRKTDGQWERFDEVHRERGYSIAELEAALRRAGFDDPVVTGSLQEIEEPDRTKRIYFLARKRE